MSENRSPVDAAIDEVERQELVAAQELLEPRQVGRIPLLTGVHRWTGKDEVTVTAVPEDDVPTLLMWDGAQGAWRPVLLPPGSKWRIVPDRAGLWTPPGAAT